MIYIWRNLFQRKVRTGLSMLGVSVSVAGIVALMSVALGMRGSLDNYMEASGASLIVISKNVADLIFSRVRPDDIELIEAVEGVDSVSRANFTMVEVGDMPMVFCFGRHPSEKIMEKYDAFLVDGRRHRALGEIMVGSGIAEDLGVSVGDTLDLFGKEILGVKEFAVVGVYESNIGWENGGVVVHADIVKNTLGGGTAFPIVFVYTTAGAVETVKQDIMQRAPHLLALHPGEFTERFNDQLEVVDDAIFLITIIALVIGVLGVLNTMMMSVAERTREIGMLRALGWSRGLVIRLILTEGILLSVMGGVIGLVLRKSIAATPRPACIARASRLLPASRRRNGQPYPIAAANHPIAHGAEVSSTRAVSAPPSG